VREIHNFHLPWRHHFQVANIARLSPFITTTVIHPSVASQAGFERAPMIVRLLDRGITMTMSGGRRRIARSVFTTDQYQGEQF
jgi:hypothetical protein